MCQQRRNAHIFGFKLGRVCGSYVCSSARALLEKSCCRFLKLKKVAAENIVKPEATVAILRAADILWYLAVKGFDELPESSKIW